VSQSGDYSIFAQHAALQRAKFSNNDSVNQTREQPVDQGRLWSWVQITGGLGRD